MIDSVDSALIRKDEIEKLSDEELFIAIEIKDYLDRKKQSLRRIG